MLYFPLYTPQIIEQIANDSVVSQADVEKYLNDSLIPYVTHQYGKSFKVNTSLEQFIKHLVNDVQNGKLRKEPNMPFSHHLIICSSCAIFGVCVCPDPCFLRYHAMVDYYFNNVSRQGPRRLSEARGRLRVQPGRPRELHRNTHD